jgi:L-lactate dehydrogenase complex protein LldG
VPIYLREARDFAFDPNELEANITANTRLLILNTPQNPTGGILKRADLEAIADILRRHPQIWIYADEIYSRLLYDGAFESLAALPGMLERTIISDGASKTWAMTGWRIGYVANRALAPVFTRWITNTDSCASQISQWAAVEAINGPQESAAAMRESFLERRDLIVGLLNAVPGVTCKTPGVRSTRGPTSRGMQDTGCADSEELRKRLLNEAGVAVLADIHFGRRASDGQHIRFSYAASPEAIRNGFKNASPASSRRTGSTAQGPQRAPGGSGAQRRSGGTYLNPAREAILSRVRAALGKKGVDDVAVADARKYVAGHAQGPRPRIGADLRGRFLRRATDMENTVESLADRQAIPVAVARYVNALDLPPALSSQKSLRGVCWPELADLDWAGAGLAIEARPTRGDDRLGVTGAFCAIAETGTLVMLAGADSPTATTLLPDTHVAVLSADRIVAGMEEAFALIRSERGAVPRAINLISGPSRTGDIEQTIVLGAHGPYRVHILVIGA